jgi:hypothetical protein
MSAGSIKANALSNRITWIAFLLFPHYRIDRYGHYIGLGSVIPMKSIAHERCIYGHCRAHDLCKSAHCIGRWMLRNSNMLMERGATRNATADERKRLLGKRV